MKTVFIFVALSLLSLATCDLCMDLYKKCDFDFGPSASVPIFTLKMKPDMAFTPRIRSKKMNMMVGVVNSNGKSAEFVFKKMTYPITNFGSPNYVPTQFKPYHIMKTKFSGIGHQSFTSKQQGRFARFRCVRVFITHYQVLGKNGQVMNKVKTPPTDKDCVVFKTK